MYYLYYFVPCFSSNLCVAIVQFYLTYSLYYPVLRVSSNLCAAYLFYLAALTQILNDLAAPTQLVPATASCGPPPLNIQWWHSCSGRPPSTIYLPALPCPHWVHTTDKSFQACPSKPLLNQNSKCCEPYLPLQAILEPTRQTKRCETVPSLINILPAPPSHFRTNINT